MGLGVAHDTAFAHPLAAHFKLRLHQQHRFGLGATSQELLHGLQHARKGDKREIGHRQIGLRIIWAVEILWREVAQVGALPQHHPGVLAQAPSGLAVAHINSIDAAGPVLQQAIAEATGGDAGIEAAAPLHLHWQPLQGCRQLLSAP